MDTVNTELIRGHVDTIILNALMQRDRYGYEIVQGAALREQLGTYTVDLMLDAGEGALIVLK